MNKILINYAKSKAARRLAHAEPPKLGHWLHRHWLKQKVSAFSQPTQIASKQISNDLTKQSHQIIYEIENF